MKVSCQEVSKRYRYQWIIRDCNWVFEANGSFGIHGPNGSGKSTLVRIISGQLCQTSGNIAYRLGQKAIVPDEIYRHVSLVGPYTNLIEELTTKEMFDFHFKFKEKKNDFDYSEFLEILRLEVGIHKRIGEFSSGMNQRLQLALALLSKTSLLLLDEPTSFLDVNAKKWFYQLLREYSSDRTIIIASNETEDFAICEQVFDLEDLKIVS